MVGGILGLTAHIFMSNCTVGARGRGSNGGNTPRTVVGISHPRVGCYSSSELVVGVSMMVRQGAFAAFPSGLFGCNATNRQLASDLLHISFITPYVTCLLLLLLSTLIINHGMEVHVCSTRPFLHIEPHLPAS